MGLSFGVRGWLCHPRFFASGYDCNRLVLLPAKVVDRHVRITDGPLKRYAFYTSKKKSEWNSQYRIALGSYFGLTAEQAKNENNFDGVCKFEENPLVTNIRLSKGENVYAAFHNLSLMEYKRDGGVVALPAGILAGSFSERFKKK